MGQSCYNLGCQPCKLGSILACCYSTCCCQCNLLIFPAPRSSYSKEGYSQYIEHFTNYLGQQIPYLFLSSKSPQKNIIYFHGNAEDINHSIEFLEPFKDTLNANIYAIQYPTYGTYYDAFPARISDKIKRDALQFYEYLKLHKKISSNGDNTIVIGRSIGSGGACYLSSKKKINNLVLISPFSTIPYVAQDFAGCVGCIVKTHFNNLQEISNFCGKLLVIHGKADEVINVRHGELVVDKYNKSHYTPCKFITPNHMSHNQFNFQNDILQPIQQFVNQQMGHSS